VEELGGQRCDACVGLGHRAMVPIGFARHADSVRVRRRGHRSVFEEV
jgi:hypothetical protein